MLSPQNKQKPLLKFLFIVLWAGLIWLAFVNAQNIKDWFKLRDYTASSAIANIAKQDSMSDLGRKIFYVNHPQITAKDTFTSDCPSATAEQTIVLGCYHSGQSGIFLLNVTDTRLDGVEQVTAAHEMLHGAYERLSSTERQQVDKMLEDFYHNGLNDDRILKTIDAYKQSEPDDLVNEMHSIFGTEVQNLPAPLENYYKKYFTDRSQVTTFAAKYQSEFTNRQNAVANYDKQLATMKQQIENMESDIKQKQQSINSQQRTLLSLRGNNIQAYNAAVPGYNASIDAYNTEVKQIHSLIDRYNQIVNTRNAIALEENELVKDLSSEAAPINN
ncbi:MAG: hypothetical protein ACXWLH_02525 [Candidatus Saccharimonadales bacterium]